MNNKVGIYYAYWTRNWDADFVDFVPLVKRLGFDILEVNGGTIARMSIKERERLKAAALSAGVELTYCIGLTREYDLASEDAATRQRGVEFLTRMADAIGDMDGKILGGIIYSSWPGKMPQDVTDKRPFLDRSVAAMTEAVKAAEDNGVLFNVEVVNRFEQYLLNTAQEAVAYVERVNSPNCKILLDTFHMNIEEETFADAIRTAGSRLGHFHLGEANRRPPGRGRLPWDEIFGALGDIGYKGAMTMEPFMVPGGEVGRDISVYRDLTNGLDLDDEAERSAKFVKDKLATL
ncbi:MAG: sugar phosphate isomerase/epimerase [Capsulimonadaceae bacterium]|nr:sugar phosphate isomerase/epimerase [Capsulimonadaceae bacterium]